MRYVVSLASLLVSTSLHELVALVAKRSTRSHVIWGSSLGSSTGQVSQLLFVADRPPDLPGALATSVGVGPLQWTLGLRALMVIEKDLLVTSSITAEHDRCEKDSSLRCTTRKDRLSLGLNVSSYRISREW